MAIENQTSFHQLVSGYFTLIFSHAFAQEKALLLESQVGESDPVRGIFESRH